MNIGEKFFGSDERTFAVLFAAVVVFYMSGFHTLAIITSVYDAMFGFAGMQKYRSTGSSESSDDGMPDEIMENMNKAMNALDDVKEEEEKA